MIKCSIMQHTAAGKTNGGVSNEQMNRDFLFAALSVVMITAWTESAGVTEYD